MTTPEQLDRLIRDYQEGKTVMPETSDEALAVDLIRLAEGFTLAPELDTALMREFQRTPVTMPIDSRDSRYPRFQPVLRRFMMGAAALAFVVLMILMVSPLRSFAQDFLRQIGAVTITDAPTGYDLYSAQPTIDPRSTPIPGIERQVYEVRFLSLEEVAALTGFDVLVAGYVPAGYRISARDVWPRYETTSGYYSVSTHYYSSAADDSVSIAQTRYDTGDPSQDDAREIAIGKAAVVDVTVRGGPGVWA
ncbi:MAG: hypothetical protein JXQ72_13060, partial [Anaerolineae bacterium]|nr:hypothetical protein [Anaerolineae bacterium]